MEKWESRRWEKGTQQSIKHTYYKDTKYDRRKKKRKEKKSLGHQKCNLWQQAPKNEEDAEEHLKGLTIFLLHLRALQTRRVSLTQKE